MPRQRQLLMIAMALAANAQTPFGSGFRRIGNRHIGKLGSDRQEMVAARPVTTLAADRPVVRHGASLVHHGLGIGRMAKQALLNSINGIECFPEEVVPTAGVGGVSRRPHPAGIPPGVIMGKPENIRTPTIVWPDE